ncbi:MAG: hypothetical protein ABW200_07695 [Hyphomicrobiaceae bacterium]
MRQIIDTPKASLLAGCALAVVLLVIRLAAADSFEVFSFLVRLLHVLAAMVWVGLIVFVNFVQLVALQGADDQVRGFFAKSVIPQVAVWYRHASTLAVASGAILLVTSGYLMPGLAYATEVGTPPARAVLLWAGVLGGLAMWMFVHMYIWPNVQVMIGLRVGDAEAKARARDKVVLFARLNLILAVPVTLAMVAAAHLY